jgi:hypothetical protein
MRERKYDRAYQKLVNEGVSVWLHPIIRPYVPKIYEMMLRHYEEIEEYEKCQFLVSMMDKYEKSIILSKIFQKLS